ncbi:MAG: multi-sensor signal transduction histidine kinase, partial [Lacunisphaera sp.]|nr:multi-sensor signal transduction histidine kinase [Lacunisphaera sp.]
MGLLFHMLQPPVKRPGWLRFIVTVVSLGVAFGLRNFLDPWLRWHSPFALLLGAVLVSAWYGGARAGLLATVAGGIGAVYKFMPVTGLVIRDVSDAVSFLLFLGEGALVSGICGVLHHAINQAQTAATEAARKFEIMANNAPVLIWSTDPVGRCVFVNHNWLMFTGRTSREELSANWPANVHPADLPAYLRSYTTASRSKRPYQLEYRLRRADGTYRWLLEHAVPRYDADGRFEGFIGSCTDITVSRREREELDFVARLQRSFGASLDLDRVATALADATVPQLADWFRLELVHDSGRLEILRSHHADPARGADLLAAIEGSAPASLLGSSARVVETGEVQFTPVVDSHQLCAGVADAARQERLRNLGLLSHLAVPLLARGRIIGVLTLATTGSGRLLEREQLSLVQKISGIAGFALDNARLYRRSLRALAGAEQARRKMADSEEALDRHRALLQTIIDSVPALVAYIGPDGRFALHNERYREWLGLA